MKRWILVVAWLAIAPSAQAAIIDTWDWGFVGGDGGFHLGTFAPTDPVPLTVWISNSGPLTLTADELSVRGPSGVDDFFHGPITPTRDYWFDAYGVTSVADPLAGLVLAPGESAIRPIATLLPTDLVRGGTQYFGDLTINGPDLPYVYHGPWFEGQPFYFTVVPEPSSFFLLGFGLLGLAGVRSRRRVLCGE